MNLMLFCSNPVNGGTARIFYELEQTLKKEKEFHLYSCVDKGNNVEVYKKIENIDYLDVKSERTLFSEKYGENGIKRLCNYIYRKSRYFLIERKNIQTFCEFITKNGIEAIMIHNGGYVGDDLCNQALKASYQCRKICKQRIMVLHNDMEKGLLKKIRYADYDRKLSKYSTHLVTVSEYTKGRICNKSFIHRNIKVIYNGLQDGRCLDMAEKEKRLKVNRNRFNVLMIGNFSENKGQDKFIEVAYFLKDEEMEFTIIGNIYDEEYYKKCKSQIESFNLFNRVKIVQGIYNAHEYIDMFDAVAVPSLYDESFGLISLEAMIAARPVVAFECGGIPEVVKNQVCGFVVPIGNSKEMAKALKWLKDHPKEQREMGNNGRKRYVDKFSVDRMRDAYIHCVRGES